MAERANDQTVTPSIGTFYVSLPDLDWGPGGQLVHPPERVVEVCVVNDLTCVSLAKYDEDAETKTCTTVAEFTVSTQALLAALVSQLDSNVAEAALRLYGNPPTTTAHVSGGESRGAGK